MVMVHLLGPLGRIDLYHARRDQHLVLTRLNRGLSDAELAILTMFRIASIRDEIEVEDPFKKVLERLLALAAMAT